MRTRILFALVAGMATTSAGAAGTEPRLEVSSHYGQMYAGRTAIDVDLIGYYNPENSTIHPVVSIEMENTGPCSDEGCDSVSINGDFGDLGPLIGVLTEARKHLADGTDFAYHVDSTPWECSGNRAFDVQVDGKARRLRLIFSKDQAAFDPDEVDYFLGILQPAHDRLMVLQPQFDAFNAATPLPHLPAPKCESAPPAKPPTAS